jgi:predicted HTH domain antitoxin
MKVTIDIPDSIEQSFQEKFGPNVERAVKEVLAIEWYRNEYLSIGQVAELLGISIYEAEGLMKQHGVVSPLTLEDFEQDRQTLNRLLNS